MMKKFMKIAAFIATMTFACGILGACGNDKETDAGVTTADVTAETTIQTEETTTEEKVAADKPVILVVSFGTSYNDSRDITIGAVEEAIAKTNPDYEVRRAFTSQIIIDKLKDRDNLEIDNVEEALDRLVADGVKELIVQPTHVMSGYEYDDLYNAVAEYAGNFDKVVMGAPLLTSDEDYDKVIKALVNATKEYQADDTAVVFMGHGTEHNANETYAKLQEKITAAGYNNYYIGTVEATPTLEDVIKSLKAGGYQKVVLEPLMIVAGDHANNDMAGDEEDSWKTILTGEGYDVECVLRGLGELEGIQAVYVEHVQAAINTNADSFVDAKNAAPTDMKKETKKVADGTYTIDVTSSSSMFKIDNAVLTVKDGEMSAILTLSGTGYEKLYMGTAADAAKASDGDFAFYKEDAEGKYTYEVAVPALDEDVACAAFSIKKQEWYDRVLVFQSATLEEVK